MEKVLHINILPVKKRSNLKFSTQWFCFQNTTNDKPGMVVERMEQVEDVL